MEYYQHANQDGKVVLFCEIFAKNTSKRDKSQKLRIFAGEMYSMICVERDKDHFDPLFTKICVKNDFYIFIPSNLDLVI